MAIYLDAKTDSCCLFDEEKELPLRIIDSYFKEVDLTFKEIKALRNFLNSLDLEPKKDCPDGQHEVKQGELKCANCGTPYLHGQK